MDRSVAQGDSLDPRTAPWPEPRTARWLVIAAGLLLALGALAVYSATRIDRYYDHFVWQAAAFLEGHAAIRFPVEGVVGVSGNAWFQDVLPIATSDGVPRGLLPFPPLPAVVLLPFVALWGLATDAQAIFTILAALDVAICWWVLGRLAIRPAIRVGGTVFLAIGTVFWFTAQVTTTWYQAHIVAMGLTLLAVGVAVGADRGADPGPSEVHRGRTDGPFTPLSGRLPTVDPRQFAAGLLFGLACTARLTVVFGAPFLALVGGGAATGAGAAGRPVSGRRCRSWPWSSTTCLPPDTSSIPPTTTCTSSNPTVIPPSATTPIGPSKTRATSRRTSGSPCSACRTCCRPGCRTASPSPRRWSAPSRARSAACSMPPVHWLCRATSG